MDHTLERLAETQHGLVTAAQLDALCSTEWERRRLIDGGPFVRVASSVYRVRGAPTTDAQRLTLGLLALGEESWVSYEAAASLHRLDGSNRSAVEFTILRGASQPDVGATVHTSKWMPPIDRVSVSGFRATSATRTIIDLAHALGSQVVAEGVESREVWAHLETLGCDLVQGYVVSEPVPLDEIDAMIHRRTLLQFPV